jgi:hypothetical protein
VEDEMGRLTKHLLVSLMVTAAAAASAETNWIAAVAHTTGVGSSLWRTDAAVLNLCDAEAVVEMLLHTDAGTFRESYTIPAGQQQIFPDVVALLADGNHTGALELRSNVGVTVTTRTYNQATEGTYGQGIDGVTTVDGLAAGDSAYLQQLKEDTAARTNIGVLNMGGAMATVTITLFDRLGGEVGSFDVVVEPGRTLQDNRPYRDRFGRSDIVGGYARITVDIGGGVFPYGSVVDSGTGDPTTILPRAGGECPADIADRLAEIDGLEVLERPTVHDGYRYFELHLEQPANHDAPDGERFEQFITLLHRSYDAPMVLRTLGYHNTRRDRKHELTEMLGSNQLVVEHRFFDDSTPSSGDWGLLDIRQAAADHHRIVEAFRPIYDGPWVSTGHSKGGMTAVFHRRFYPDDVDATVAYVAPISYGPDDERYLDFLADVGTPQCNQALWDVQVEVLERRQTMLPLFESSTPTWTYDWVGGRQTAFEMIVLELPFTFWQYAGESFCSVIPEVSSSDQALFGFIDDFVGWWYVADFFLDDYSAYFYQAHTELGYPAVATDHLGGLILTDPPSPEAGALPPGVTAAFDLTVMPDIADWMAADGERILLIYGEFDPWTAGAFDLGGAVDSHLFVDPGGTHGSYIRTLEPDDQAAVMQILHRWTGVRPILPAAIKATPDRYPPWRRLPPGLDVAAR